MAKFLKLQNGAHMHTVGFGTWQSKDEDLEIALEAALVAGYRHIDTAYAYQNEHVIGKVIQRWITSGALRREDLFIVTKLPTIGIRPEGVTKFLNKSLEALQLTYVDLYLIHTPYGFMDNDTLMPIDAEGNVIFDMETDLIATWKAMEEQVKAGKTKAIGVSNFNMEQIDRILKQSRIPPANLQIELHAYHQQKELVKFCTENKITVTAYAPIGSPGLKKYMKDRYGADIECPDILNNPVVQSISQSIEKTEAQILLRHALQNGLIVIPKSVNKLRLKNNLSIYDFQLNAMQMKKLDALDQGRSGKMFDVQLLNGISKHPEYPFKENN